jgi:hypothetical protein
MTDSRNWQDDPKREQLNTLHAACGDLAAQIEWHGQRLSKDDFRHLICGTVLGWRMMPAFDMGQGAPGFIMLGGSSLDLTKQQATVALTMAFSLGDDPSSQGLKSPPVRWCRSVCGARWIAEEEMAA